MAFEHQVIRVKGSPFERGVAYGEQDKERILRTLSLYGGRQRSLGLGEREKSRLAF